MEFAFQRRFVFPMGSVFLIDFACQKESAFPTVYQLV
jgi:hypothetical protein